MSVASTISEYIENDTSVQEEKLNGESQTGKENVGLPHFRAEEVDWTEEDTVSIKMSEKDCKANTADNVDENCEVEADSQNNRSTADLHETKIQAIEHFCNEEAEKIIKEAILIKHVLDEDKFQFTASSKSVVDKITGEKRTSEGYDRYLIDKLLHSEPDPSEEILEGFIGLSESGGRENIKGIAFLEDGKDENKDREEDFESEDIAREIPEEKAEPGQSILHKEFDLTEAFGENALQTIDEDKELTLHTDRVDDDNKAGDEEEEKELSVDEEIMALETDSHGEESHKEQDLDEEIFQAEAEIAEADAEVAELDAESSEDDEEDIGEMTHKQKKAVVAAVRQGDIDLLEDLLDKRHADINMLWYNENLIMVAIRAKQEQMAEFLIDNEVDVSHTVMLIEKAENGDITTYPQTCRDMAFDRNMEDLVELIDYKTNNLFSFVKPKERQIRIRRPRPPTPPTPEVESEDDFTMNDGSPEREGTMKSTEDLVLTEAKLKKFERDLDSGLNSSNNAENDRKRSVIKSERVHSEDHTNSGNESHRDSVEDSSHVSHVFGMDEGYETMSPVSPVCAPLPPRLEHNVVGTKEHVSIRGTRASHSTKMHNVKTMYKISHSQMDNPMLQSKSESYSRDNRRWHQTKSAPALRSRQSFESIPEVVRTGAPFVHGDKKFIQHNLNPTVISPYSQVAKLLAGSRILKPKSASSLPSIHSHRTKRPGCHPIRTETHYIYSDRNSANTYDRISFLHQPRVATAGSGISRPRNAWQ